MHSIAVHALTTKLRQQCRVNIERATLPCIRPAHAESPQVASEAHEVHVVRAQCRIHSIIKCLGWFRLHHCYWNAVRLAARHSAGISTRDYAYRNDRWNLATRTRMRNIDNGAPAPRGERTDSNSFGRR
jgi:hypothetical protein